MAMDDKRARKLLLEVRHEFDIRAKEIVEGLKEENQKEELESRLADAISDFRGEMIGAFEEEFAGPMRRVIAAFEQWEITESYPLNEDDSFMYALRELLRVRVEDVIDKAINEGQRKRG